jgi:hypothetical protein
MTNIFTIIGIFTTLCFLGWLVEIGIPSWIEERRISQHRRRIIKDNIAAGRHWADGLSDASPGAPENAQLRWEEEQRKKEEEARKVHYAPGPRQGADPNRGGSGVTKDGYPIYWD